MRVRCPVPVAAFLCLLEIACGAREPSPPATGGADAAAKAAYDSWRSERLSSLQKEDGWLALSGLHWLAPGEHSVGSAADSAIVLPAGAPPHLGVLSVTSGAVRLTLAAGVAATIDGAPFASGSLRSDADPAVPQDRVRVGGVTLSIIERGGRQALRVHDASAATRTGFAGIETFPWDARWIVRARLERFDAPKEVAVPTVIGVDDEATVPGVVTFEIDGVPCRLEPYLEGGGTELFFDFSDATNGHETYGGGRFLTAELPAEGSDTVILDFNRAFSPPCAFTPYATCPVPRPESRLRVRVAAGEKARAHR